MAVNGPDAYVSADWYASPDQVPTWLYQAVHLTGPVRALHGDELGPHLDVLSAKLRRLARAEAAVDIVQNDGRSARCDEEGDRRFRDGGG